VGKNEKQKITAPEGLQSRFPCSFCSLSKMSRLWYFSLLEFT